MDCVVVLEIVSVSFTTTLLLRRTFRLFAHFCNFCIFAISNLFGAPHILIWEYFYFMLSSVINYIQSHFINKFKSDVPHIWCKQSLLITYLKSPLLSSQKRKPPRTIRLKNTLYATSRRSYWCWVRFQFQFNITAELPFKVKWTVW